MTIASQSPDTRPEFAMASPCGTVLKRERQGGQSNWLVSLVARLVLALLIGASFHSVQHVLPHSGKQTGPLLGI